jgi:hypothetical protein
VWVNMYSTGENGAAACSERPSHPCCIYHPAFHAFLSSITTVKISLSSMDSMAYVFLLICPRICSRLPSETATRSGEDHVDLQRAVIKVCWRYTAAHGCGKGTHRRAARCEEAAESGARRCRKLLGLGGDAVNASLS